MLSFRMIAFSLFTLLIWGEPLLGSDDVTLQPLAKAFVPGGFTDRDQVEFVVSGTLPATNYSVQQIKFEVDQKNRVISVKQYLREYPNSLGFKPEKPIDVVNVVTMRKPIDSGDYKIIDAFNDAEIGQLQVSKASNREKKSHKLEIPTIERVNVEANESGSPELFITATLPKSVLLETEIQYFDTSIVVRPVLPESNEAFEKDENVVRTFRYPLRDSLNGDYLLHVRYATSDEWTILQAKTVNRLLHFPLEK